MISVKGLYVYPVKSLAGFSVTTANLTDRGFQYDRRWMLIDEHNRFISQREFPKMALLQTAITDTHLEIFLKNDESINSKIPLEISSPDLIKVQIWDDTTEAILLPDNINNWFSKILETNCCLVYMPDSIHRLVDERYATHQEITGFSDAYPLTVISDESLNDLNARLEKKIQMNRFRPNIIIEGCYPYFEDQLKHFSINNIEFFGVKLLARCPIPTIDQDTAVKGKEPIKTLSKYRTKNNKVYFGQNLIYNQKGQIRIGDELKIVSLQPPAFDHSI